MKVSRFVYRSHGQCWTSRTGQFCLQGCQLFCVLTASVGLAALVRISARKCRDWRGSKSSLLQFFTITVALKSYPRADSWARLSRNNTSRITADRIRYEIRVAEQAASEQSSTEGHVPQGVSIIMSSAKHQLRWMSAIAVLLVLALGVACKGFFQNPTLTSIAVGPATPTIETGSTDNTIQMNVTGTNNDGSTTTNPSVSWSVTPTSVATISSSGLVTSVSVGTATVTATANQNSSISGTQSVTVTVGCIESIKITPSSVPTLTSNQPSQQLTAEATTCNGPADITQVATWTPSNSSLITVSAGLVQIVSGNTTPGTATVTASIGSIFSTPVTITVSP